MLAHYYNQNVKDNLRVNVVYTCKEVSNGKWVQDVERGVLEGISPYPWQTDTSIGDWYYRTGQKYKSADEVVQLLMDIVSKNGNLLINVVQTPEGDLEQDVLDIMENISKWIAANGEGVYATRPWKVYGEGPSTLKEIKKQDVLVVFQIPVVINQQMFDIQPKRIIFLHLSCQHLMVISG